jgi:hypothetical protein
VRGRADGGVGRFARRGAGGAGRGNDRGDAHDHDHAGGGGDPARVLGRGHGRRPGLRTRHARSAPRRTHRVGRGRGLPRRPGHVRAAPSRGVARAERRPGRLRDPGHDGGGRGGQAARAGIPARPRHRLAALRNRHPRPARRGRGHADQHLRRGDPQHAGLDGRPVPRDRGAPRRHAGAHRAALLLRPRRPALRHRLLPRRHPGAAAVPSRPRPRRGPPLAGRPHRLLPRRRARRAGPLRRRRRPRRDPAAAHRSLALGMGSAADRRRRVRRGADHGRAGRLRLGALQLLGLADPALRARRLPAVLGLPGARGLDAGARAPADAVRVRLVRRGGLDQRRRLDLRPPDPVPPARPALPVPVRARAAGRAGRVVRLRRDADGGAGDRDVGRRSARVARLVPRGMDRPDLRQRPRGAPLPGSGRRRG